MRLRWKILGLAALALRLSADGGLAASLLAAKDAGARSELLRGHTPPEIAQALDELEKTGAARIVAHDSAGALAAFQTALDAAQASGVTARVPYYLRQIGIRQSLAGHQELALETYRQGAAAAENGADSAILAENLHGEALALERLGRYREALPFSQRECALVEKGAPADRIRALITDAAILGNLGRMKESVAIDERAAELARDAKLEEMLQAVMSNLAFAYSGMGENETALRFMHELLDRRIAPAPADWVNIGAMERAAHRPDAAAEAYRKGITMATAPEHWPSLNVGLINLAILEHSRRQFAEARAHLEKALQLAREHKNLDYQASALTELTGVSLDEGNNAAALAEAEEGLQAARASSVANRLGEALQEYGLALEASGRQTEAGHTFAEAIEVVESIRAEAPSFSLGLSASQEHWMPVYQYAVRHALRTGDAAGALRYCERAKARVLLDMLEGGGQSLDAYLTSQEHAEMQRLASQVTAARRAYLASAGATSRQPLADAERAAEYYEQRQFSRHPELVLQSVAIPDLQPAQLAALLPDSRTALIDYFLMDKEVAIFVIRAGDTPGAPAIHAVTLPFDERAESQIRAFHKTIAERGLNYRLAARHLFDLIVGPALAQLRGSDRWILSPSALLWELPFQALIDPAGKHLLETHSIVYAPSLSSLWALRQRGTQPEDAAVSLLTLANPSKTGLAPIPAAESESKAIARIYGSTRSVVLTGADAGVLAFRENAGKASVIHLSTHAESDSQHPLDSFLSLTPGKSDDGALTAREILSLRLHASLVVLSACETARGEITQGEGILGLGWAFEAAGAASAVLSQWKVDSAATRDLMIEFHRRLTASPGAGKAEALRQASLATMRMPGRAHPFYWAPFMLTGDAR